MKIKYKTVSKLTKALHAKNRSDNKHAPFLGGYPLGDISGYVLTISKCDRHYKGLVEQRRLYSWTDGKTTRFKHAGMKNKKSTHKNGEIETKNDHSQGAVVAGKMGRKRQTKEVSSCAGQPC